jgi:hypothetical protein
MATPMFFGHNTSVALAAGYRSLAVFWSGGAASTAGAVLLVEGKSNNKQMEDKHEEKSP